MRVIIILLCCIIFLDVNVVQSMHQHMTSTEFFHLSLFHCGGRNLYRALDNTAHYNDAQDHNIVVATAQEGEIFPIGQVEQFNYGSVSFESSQNFIRAHEVEPLTPVLYAVNSSRHVTVIYEEQFTRNADGTINIPAVREQEFCTENTRNCLNCCVFSTLVSLTCFACIFHR